MSCTLSVLTSCSLIRLILTLLLECVLVLFLKNIKVHSHKILILSVLQRGIWILLFIEDASCSFLIPSMNLKNLTRVLHMWTGCCLDFLFLRGDLPSYKCSSPEFVCAWSTILFTGLIFKALFSEEFTHRRNQVNPSRVPHSHVLRVSVGNGTFASAVRALLKALNSSGFFPPWLSWVLLFVTCSVW